MEHLWWEEGMMQLETEQEQNGFSVLTGCISQGRLQNVSGVLSWSPKSLSISQVSGDLEEAPAWVSEPPNLRYSALVLS